MKNLSPEAAEITRREWRELRFFYFLDDEAREWQLTGSREGLLSVAEKLDAYAGDPDYAGLSEHEHFGPHMYLEVMTWSEAGIDGHSIHGTQDDIRRLAVLIRQKLSAARAGDVVILGDEHVASAEYRIILRVREDDFDPATEDPQLMEQPSDPD